MTEVAAPHSPPAAPPRWWNLPAAQYGALVLLVLLAYVPVGRAGFIWDDDTHLTANSCIVGPLGLKEVWTTPSANYFPLVLTTYWFEHALWDLRPLPYHLVNVALHATTAVLLVVVLRRLRVRAPWWGAALWALHPVQAESVAWVSELTNAQSGFFFLLATALYLERSELSRRRFVGVCLCAVAAMLSKPSTVMLPIVLLLCRWWQDRAWSWRHAIRLAPLFALSVLVSGWTVWEQRYHSQALGPEWTLGAVTRLAIAGRDVWFYLFKLLWPNPLAFVYPRWQVPQAIGDLWPAALGAAIWAALWFNRQGRLRPLFLGTTYFIALLFPVLGFFNIYFFRYSFVADHFQYLAAIGPLAGCAAALDLLAAKVRSRVSPLIVATAAAAGLAGLLVTTLVRVPVLASSATVWRATLAANPECWIAETIVGNLDSAAGQHAVAARRHEHAIALDPLAPEPHYNLGIALSDLGRYEDAIREYERGLQLKPNDPDLEHNLGVALSAVGRRDDAIDHFERALKVRPNFAPTEVMLALALTLSNRGNEALPHYENAIRVQPANYKAQYSYARALEILGRYDDAIPHFHAAIKISPNDPSAHGHLGMTLARLRDTENAVLELKRAAELEPANDQWREELAKLSQ